MDELKPSASGKVSSPVELQRLPPPSYDTVVIVKNGPRVMPQTSSNSEGACQEMFCSFSTYGRLVLLSGVAAGIVLLVLHYTVHESQTNWALITGAALLMVFYPTYLCETFCCNSSYNYLSNAEVIKDVHKHIAEVKASSPVITWDLQFYHTEMRERYIGSGNSQSTQHYEQRVDTDRVTEDFRFARWTDESASIQLANLAPTAHARIKFDKMYQFADELTKQAYEHQKADFIASNRYRDRKYDFTETLHIDGYQEAVLATLTGELPFFMRKHWYVLAVLLLLELPYSSMMKMQSLLAEYRYVKRVYI